MDDARRAELRVLRQRTLAAFADLGRVPVPADLGNEDEIIAGWRDLQQIGGLVLDESRTSIRMAHPFSGVATPYRTRVGEKTWFANCGWDAFGILGYLKSDEGSVEATCADCGDHLQLAVNGRTVDREEMVFHCLLPAKRWFEDIVFT